MVAVGVRIQELPIIVEKVYYSPRSAEEHTCGPQLLHLRAVSGSRRLKTYEAQGKQNWTLELGLATIGVGETS